MVSAGAARVDLKGEGQVTRYTVDENGDLIEGLSVETRRVRVSAQGRTPASEGRAAPVAHGFPLPRE